MDEAQHKLLREFLKLADLRDANHVAMDMLKKNQEKLEGMLAGLNCEITQATWCEYQHDRELYK